MLLKRFFMAKEVKYNDNTPSFDAPALSNLKRALLP